MSFYHTQYGRMGQSYMRKAFIHFWAGYYTESSAPAVVGSHFHSGEITKNVNLVSEDVAVLLVFGNGTPGHQDATGAHGLRRHIFRSPWWHCANRQRQITVLYRPRALSKLTWISQRFSVMREEPKQTALASEAMNRHPCCPEHLYIHIRRPPSFADDHHLSTDL